MLAAEGEAWDARSHLGSWSHKGPLFRLVLAQDIERILLCIVEQPHRAHGDDVIGEGVCFGIDTPLDPGCSVLVLVERMHDGKTPSVGRTMEPNGPDLVADERAVSKLELDDPAIPGPISLPCSGEGAIRVCVR